MAMREEVDAQSNIVVQVEAISSSLREKWFKSVQDAMADYKSQSPSPYTRIQKVPFMLQGTKDFKKYFEPRVVSIGPYHHDKDELKPAEALKLKFTNKFVENCHQPIEVLYNKIFKEIKKLRECYEEEATKKYDDEALAWMLLVDGCSILHYIDCQKKGTLNDWMIKEYHTAFVYQDLFLLENQIPFRVLELLMDEKYDAKEVDTSTTTTATATPGFQCNHEGMKKIKEFVQLSIEIPQVQKQRQQSRPRPQPQQEAEQQVQQPAEKYSHLLDLLRKELIHNPNKKSTNETYDWNSFRSITELTELGIVLKPSGTSCLKDVSFRAGCIYADLNLPPIKVDDSTRSMFLNLIAFEMSPDVDTNFEITSYICFLESLIDHANDVKQLREASILYNFLGSDDEVADLFNEIGTDLAPNDAMYRDVKAQIQRHCDKRKRSNLAKFIHTHFGGPVSLISFLTFLGIYISLIQTYYAIPSSGKSEPKHKN